MYWQPVAAARRDFNMVLFTASRGNTFIGGKCALPSALLVKKLTVTAKLCKALYFTTHGKHQGVLPFAAVETWLENACCRCFAHVPFRTLHRDPVETCPYYLVCQEIQWSDHAFRPGLDSSDLRESIGHFVKVNEFSWFSAVWATEEIHA